MAKSEELKQKVVDEYITGLNITTLKYKDTIASYSICLNKEI